MTAPAVVDVEEAAKWVESLALVRAHRHQQTVVAALIRHQAEQIRDLQERLDAEGPKFDARASKWLEQIAELRNTAERYLAALNFISTATTGGELFPVGPTETRYAEDGNTVLEYIGPWHFLRGQGPTFLDAVENEIALAGINAQTSAPPIPSTSPDCLP